MKLVRATHNSVVKLFNSGLITNLATSGTGASFGFQKDDYVVSESKSAIEALISEKDTQSAVMVTTMSGAATLVPLDNIESVFKSVSGGSIIKLRGKGLRSLYVRESASSLWEVITGTSDIEKALAGSESPSSDNPFVTGSELASTLASALAPYAVKMVKKTIGGVGVEDCDFNFATAEDMEEQVIDLGELIPGLGRIVDVFTHTNAAFTGAVSLAADIGTTSGGAELIASGTILAADAIRSIAAGSSFVAAPSVAAKHVYVNATPGANWSLVIAGKMTVYVIYIDVNL